MATRDIDHDSDDDDLVDELCALTSDVGDSEPSRSSSNLSRRGPDHVLKEQRLTRLARETSAFVASNARDSFDANHQRLFMARSTKRQIDTIYTSETSTKTESILDDSFVTAAQPEANHINNSNAPGLVRSDSLQEPKSLFQGWTFYFEPNNDVNKIRKRRIQAAIAQGAIWSRKLDQSVTHFIVDANITADSVWKHYESQLRFVQPHIVKDTWLIECLSHKTRRDPSQGRFKLKGADAVFVIPSSGKECRPSLMSDHDSALPEAPKAILVTTVEGSIDELQQIMQDIKQADQLPFDAEVDLEKFVSFMEDEEQVSLSSSTMVVPKENKGFACMEPNNGKISDNPNTRTIEILQQMATYYDRTGDNWRTLAYRKAITALGKQKELITTKKQALKINGIGTRLADKIEEISTTDRLTRLDAVSADPNEQVLQLFMGVYGAGARQARLWMEQGLHTLDDLKEKGHLTTNQKIGVEHYDDFQQRIPRAEVKKHGDEVQKALRRVNKELEGIIGGSYRRGMPNSGDIDVMIMHPTADLSQLREWVFGNAVPYLFGTGFLKAALATSRTSEKQAKQKSPAKGKKRKAPEDDAVTNDAPYFASSSDRGSKFHGASCLPDSTTWRRIDLLLVPACSRGAALIYFTGNDIFNRSIRLLASRKGMRLNQHGLYKNCMRGPGRVKQTEGELVEGRDEKKIFEILGVPWREPHERRC